MKTAIRIVCRVAAWYIMVSTVFSLMVSLGVFRWEIISRRAPFVIIDAAFSKVEGEDHPNHKYGFDQHDEYIGFDPDAIIGDKVLSLMVFSPLNNEVDDIVERFDISTSAIKEVLR